MRGRVERILEEKQKFWGDRTSVWRRGFEARVSLIRPNEEEKKRDLVPKRVI